MQEGVLLRETRKRGRHRQNLPGLVGVAPGEVMSLGLVMIGSREPLWTVVDSRQDIRRARELDQTAVCAGLRINAKWDRKWRRRASQAAQGAQI